MQGVGEINALFSGMKGAQTPCGASILLTFIKLPLVIKIFVLSICEWPLKTGFTVHWTCNIKAYDEFSSDSLFTKLGIKY